MLFKKAVCERSTVRNQCGEVPADKWETVFDFLRTMFDDPDHDEFVVLTLADIGTCPHSRSTLVLRRIFRITSLIFLEIHTVFLRKIALFCEKSASQSEHFGLYGQVLKHNIRYVQSAWTADGFTVQLGIEEENGTRLVEKDCSEEECVGIFREYYNTTNVSKLKEYSEVKF